MTNGEAVNWLRNIAYDTGKAEHSDLWHYQQALFEIIDMLEGQPDLDEWCADCKEYDSERHCCPRFNRVIRDAVEEVREKIIHCRYCKHWDELLNLCKRTKHMALGVNGFCSKAERKEG